MRFSDGNFIMLKKDNQSLGIFYKGEMTFFFPQRLHMHSLLSVGLMATILRRTSQVVHHEIKTHTWVGRCTKTYQSLSLSCKKGLNVSQLANLFAVIFMTETLIIVNNLPIEHLRGGALLCMF